MKKLIFAFGSLLFSLTIYSQEFIKTDKRDTFNFQINVTRSIHGTRGIAEKRTIFSTTVPAKCSYFINGAESENTRLNKGQKLQALGAIQREMQYQFFEYLNNNYPTEIENYKHMGYNIICNVVDEQTTKPVFREYSPTSMSVVKQLGLDTTPSTPLPDYDATKLILVTDFTYKADNCIKTENIKMGNLLESKYLHTKDHKEQDVQIQDFSALHEKYASQEYWKSNQSSSRRGN
ncbi:hypothetical protein DFQ03_3815 [Maribacter caenipelagi]|uniref:GLPGLI family protein n=1 Tax=Maribacter caenipelagi TaxID=1447781 RepID=A0A4R7CW77_9FLAO|nr:hypothetical protein [Maribacter caenipelagi]TDS10922.1 hypothetical protein DFQ03_3815 [Maribacter caenipelagi]